MLQQRPHAEDNIGSPAYSTSMKAITIWQPWATLMALRLKGFETRSRRTHYRGPIAIHAGLRVDREACEREPIKSVLAQHGYTADNLPTGAVVAIAELADCLEIARTDGEGEKDPVWLRRKGSNKESFRNIMWAGKKPDEYYFGNYNDGRFALEMANVKALEKPLPAKGQQGLWNWDGGFL